MPKTDVTLTNQQICEADSALAALGNMDLPMRLAMKVARMRLVTLPIAREVPKIRIAALERYAAKDDDGSPKAERNTTGSVALAVSATDQYRVEKEYQALLLHTATVAIEQLTEQEFPAKIKGEALTISGEIFVALGPLFLLDD